MMPYYPLKMIICLIVFTVCPFLLGENVVILTKFNINSKVIALLYRYVMGWVLELALFQVFAVPFILFKTHFTYLLIVWVLFLVVLMLSGVFFCFKNLKKNADILELKTSERVNKIEKIELIVSMCIMVGVIGFQLFQYGVKMHTDLDDSRFVANTIEAVDNDTMFLRSPATGEYVGTWTGEQEKDVTSPWMLMYAALAKITGLSAATIVHTVMPVILLLLSYFTLWMVGDELTEHNLQHTVYFTIFSALLYMVFSGSTYTRGVFMLTRIWQGKAAVAAFFIPLVFYFFVRHFRQEENVIYRTYLELMIINFALCLTTGVGLITAAVLTGGYGIWAAIAGKRIKNLFYSWSCELPIILYGCIQIIIKGGI